MNTPYKKVYENGILTNPITKDNPYLQNVTQRPFKRDHLKLKLHHIEFDGTKKFITLKRTKRGNWITISN